MAVGAACCYGLTVVVNRSLARDGVGATTVLSIRFAVAAVGALAIARLLHRPLVPVPGERLRALVVGMVGYSSQTLLFFAALERGSASAVTLVFYAYPSIVTVLAAVLGWEAVDRRRVAALVLAAAGTVLVVAGGESVDISAGGVACALGAALAFASYFLAGSRLLPRTDGLTTGAWVAAGAALSWVTAAALTGGWPGASGHEVALVGNGLATSGAFGLMFLALVRIGPGRTAVAMTTEAAAAVVLAAVFLDESLEPVQLLGGVVILAGAVLVARARRVPST